MVAHKPTWLPALGAPVADAHAHLGMLEDPAGALAGAARAGVELVVAVCDADSVDATLEGLAAWLAEAERLLASQEAGSLTPPFVRVTLGLHPHRAQAFDGVMQPWLAERLNSGRFVAVGEIGLDFHYNHSPRDDQRRAFRSQLMLAHQLELPAVIHMREAHNEVITVLRELGVPEAGCVMHCFTEGPEIAEQFLKLGCYLSFAGPVTFRQGGHIREAARATPLERLMVETDSPFLTPVPYRGRPNEPAFCTLNAARIAELKNLPASAVAEAALANTYRILGGRPDGKREMPPPGGHAID